MRSLLSLINIDCRMNYVSWRFKFGMILQIVNIIVVMSPLRALSLHYDLPVHIGVVSFIYSNEFALMISLISYLIIFSNLPLVGAIQLYSRMRSSTFTWVTAQFCYIILTSFLYVLISVVTVITSLVGCISISLEWGKLLGSLAYYPGMVEEFGIGFNVVPELVSNSTPFELIGYSLLLCFVIGVFSGVTILTINFMRIGLGIVAYSFLIILNQAILTFGDYRLFYWTPLSWLSLTNISTHSFDAYPDKSYVLIFLGAAIFVQVGICLYWTYAERDSLTTLFT